MDGDHYTEIYPEELEFACRLVGFKDLELRRFEGSPLTSEAMAEWKEEIPQIISKIENRDLRTAFLKATTRIMRTYKEQGGTFPPFYVIRMKK